MGRFILLVIALFVLIALVRGALATRRRDASPQGREESPAALVRCAHCGVHVPRSEAQIGSEDRVYCSDAHRRLGARD